jgi:hypothetical protein
VLLYLLLFFCEPGDLTFTNADTGLKERKKERKKDRKKESTTVLVKLNE